MKFSSDLPGIMAIQHRVIKDLKKQHGLRQRDWEILCACYMLSLVKFPFTATKVEGYLGGSYFLPSIYDSIGVLLEKGYIHALVPGKPFRPEGYEFTAKGRDIVKRYCNEIRRLSDDQEFKVTGKAAQRLW